MKHRSIKGTLAFLLSCLFLLCLAPSAVLAEEQDDYEDWTSTDSLPTSGTYRLTDDVTVNNGISVGQNTLVLDLNGYTVNFNTQKGDGLTLFSGGSLTIEDNSEGQPGKMTNQEGHSAAYSLIAANGGTVTLKGGTLESYGGNAIYAYNRGNVVLSGAKIHNVGSSGGYALYANSGSTVEITSGEIVNQAQHGDALYANDGSTVNITSGEIVNEAKNGCAMYINQNSVVTLKDGLIKNTQDGGDAIYNNKDGTFIMNGGEVSQEGTYGSDAAIYCNNTAAQVTINGGTVTSKAKGVYAAFTPVTVTGGTIEAESYAFHTRYADVTPAAGKTVNVQAGTAILYTFSGSDNKIEGGNFTSQAILKEYTSEEQSVTTITGGVFTPASPAEYVQQGIALMCVEKQEGSKQYAVGLEDIADIAKDAAEGDTIDVLAGDVDFTDLADGVAVKNSGGGTVTANGSTVTTDAPITVCNHTWAAVWEWDGTNAATATFTCRKDAEHTETVSAIITSQEIIPSTCTQMGTTRYTATVEFDGESYEDQKEETDIPTKPHEYVNGTCTVCGGADPDYVPPYVPPAPVAPSAIQFTAAGDLPGTLELKQGESITMELGTIDNYAAFAAAGAEVTAAPTCDPGLTLSVSVDQHGKLSAHLSALEPGKHQVAVSLLASGCDAVAAVSFTVTVPQPQPVEQKILIEAASGCYTGVKGTAQLLKADKTARFTVQGLKADESVTWKSTKPKYLSIDSDTGEAQLKKAGSVTVTATLSDGTVLSQKVNVNRGTFADSESLRLQTKVDGKWTDVPEEGIVVVPKKSGQKSVPSRLVGEGGKIVIESVDIDQTLATRSGDNPAPIKVKKRSVTDGKTVILAIKANGREFTLPIVIDSTAKDVYPDDLIAEVEEILQQEEK